MLINCFLLKIGKLPIKIDENNDKKPLWRLNRPTASYIARDNGNVMIYKKWARRLSVIYCLIIIYKISYSMTCHQESNGFQMQMIKILKESLCWISRSLY